MRMRKPQNAGEHKKRIFDVVNQLNEEELEKVSEMLRATDAIEKQADDEVEMEQEDDFANEDVDGKSLHVGFAQDQVSSVSQAVSNSTAVISLTNQLN